MIRLTPALLALGLATAACGGGEVPAGECKARGVISVGERIPDCDFESLDGERVSLRSLEDKPLVLNFWASWCLACIKEMPAIDRIWKDLGNEVHILGMDVVGVQGETRSLAEGFLSRTPVAYPIAFDDDGALYEHFATSKARPIMPVTVFVAEGGIVKLRRFGELSEAELRDFIRDELAVG